MDASNLKSRSVPVGSWLRGAVSRSDPELSVQFRDDPESDLGQFSHGSLL